MKDAESVQNIPLKEGRHQIAEHVILKDGSMLVAEALELKLVSNLKYLERYLDMILLSALIFQLISQF